MHPQLRYKLLAILKSRLPRKKRKDLIHLKLGEVIERIDEMLYYETFKRMILEKAYEKGVPYVERFWFLKEVSDYCIRYHGGDCSVKNIDRAAKWLLGESRLEPGKEAGDLLEFPMKPTPPELNH